MPLSYSHFADSSGLNSNIKDIELTYQEAHIRISKCQSKLERLRMRRKIKSKQINTLQKVILVRR